MPTFTSKKDFVYHALRQAIVSGRYEEGSRLIIDSIATEYKVSIIPVREAIQMLEREGFVTTKTHSGAVVRELSPEAIDEVFDLLEALEVISARAACKNATDDDLAHLKTLVVKMDGQLEDEEAWSQTNMEFHQAICQSACYPLTQRLLESVRVHWDRVRILKSSEDPASQLIAAQKQHWKILKALEKRDSEKVVTLLAQHNKTARRAHRLAISPSGKS